MASSGLLSMEFPTRWREIERKGREGRGGEGERGFFRFPVYSNCLFSEKKMQTRGQNIHSKGQKRLFGFNNDNNLLSSFPTLNDVRLSKKTSRFACYSILDDVPHLSNWCPNLPTYRNPLQDNPAYQCVEQYFVAEDDVVIKDVVVKEGYDPSSATHFRRAGPRDEIVFKPDEVRACVVTCGGLCPGLNTVIREIVCSLWMQYGVREIYGIDGGYRGFYAKNVLTLDPKVVNDIHKRGGTILHTSRGGHETSKIVNAIEDRGINQVYIIGGDGTQRGADLVYKEVMRRGLKVAVAGIPKTIDNDIPVIDKSFGFDTAVEEAQRAINAAHVEAESVENGFGLVKLMGRYSGYIAMHATLASRDVDCCLIPEVPFYLEGPGGLYEYIRKILRENGHMVLVVAEGAGQEFISKTEGEMSGRDKSGNRLLQDVGLWLSHNIKEYLRKAHIEVNLKYIDPTYMIRAIPSNASDNVYCTLLAHSAIHGAMAGFSGFIAGPVNGRHAYIPIDRVTETTNKVNVTDRMWARLLSSTQQPSFNHMSVISKPKEQLPDVSATKIPVVSQTISEKMENGVPSGIVEVGREALAKTQDGKVGFSKSEGGGKGKDFAKGEVGKVGFTKSEDGGKDFAKTQDGKVGSTKSHDGGVASNFN